MSRSRSRKIQQSQGQAARSEPANPLECVLDRARRFIKRGEDRRALLTLEQACYGAAQDARVWALYAAHCQRTNRLADAERAFRQALYLRERERDEARAVVLRRLLDELVKTREAA